MFVLILFCNGEIKSVQGPFPTREAAQKLSDELNFGKFGKVMYLHNPLSNMIDLHELEESQDVEDLAGK